MSSNQQRAFTALRRFATKTAAPDAVLERCEVCGTAVAHEHEHLYEPVRRQLICTCDACAISVGEQVETPYRRVPHRVRSLPDFQLAVAQWDSLLIPVGMAFFFQHTPTDRFVVYYPSPAGATESLLSLETWEEVVHDNPILRTMEPDVEALLVNRLTEVPEYFLVPIDRCYELVGLIRTKWQGFSGGTEVWEAIGQFFAGLRAQAGPAEATAHA